MDDSDFTLKDLPVPFILYDCKLIFCNSYKMAFFLHFFKGQILHTDVVYLHCGQGFREAEKIKRLLLNFKYENK
jgi:uncharacterized protein (DUF488 family)